MGSIMYTKHIMVYDQSVQTKPCGVFIKCNIE